MKKILVVDDEDMILHVAARQFKKYGIVVFTALTIIEALAIAVDENPDLILTDCDMPDGGGFSLMEELRAVGYTGAVMMQTGLCTEARQEQAKAAGFLTCLAKPIRAEEVIACILVSKG